MYDDSDYCRRKKDCRCNRCCDRPTPDRPVRGFMSCYLEAVGDIQSVNVDSDIVFDISSDIIDIAGHGISLNSRGNVFRITRPGLYHVEWSVNVNSSALPICIGLLENGESTSAMSSAVASGTISSGALINVKSKDLPTEIRLHNFGNALEVTRETGYENTAVSIRILRFADGESVFYNEH